MIKIFAVLILALVLACVIFILIIKNQKLKNKDLNGQIEDCKSTYFELNTRYEKLLEEFEIEKKNNKELAKRLANISCMSIDDILQQLQHNESGRKDNNLHS